MVSNHLIYLKIDLVKNFSTDLANFSKEKLILIEFLLNKLIQIDPNQRSNYLFSLAETFSSIKNFEKSWSFYKASIETLDLNSLSLLRDNFDSLFKILENGLESISLESEIKLFTFEKFLHFFPNDPLSKSIFKKLILFFIFHKKPEEAFKTLLNFHKNFPGLLIDQQDLMRSVLDLAFSTNNEAVFSSILLHLKASFLSFDDSFIKKVEDKFGDLLFRNSEKYENEKNFPLAIQGYDKVIFSKIYPASIRFKAAFRKSYLLIINSQFSEAFDLMRQSIDFLSKEDLLLQLNNFLYLNELFFSVGAFEIAESFSTQFLHYDLTVKHSTFSRFFYISFFSKIHLSKRKEASRLLKDKKSFLKEEQINECVLSLSDAFFLNKDFYGYKDFFLSFQNDFSRGLFFNHLKNWYFAEESYHNREVLISFLSFVKTKEAMDFEKEIKKINFFISKINQIKINLSHALKFGNSIKFSGPDAHLSFISDLQVDFIEILKSTFLEFRVQAIIEFNDLIRSTLSYLSELKKKASESPEQIELSTSRLRKIVHKNEFVFYELSKKMEPSFFLTKFVINLSSFIFDESSFGGVK